MYSFWVLMVLQPYSLIPFPNSTGKIPARLLLTALKKP